jgi:hypothetical protein
MLASGCTASREAAPVEVELTREELQEIRAAAIRYYQEKKPEMWEVFVEELQRGALFLKKDLPEIGQPAIGIWRIEQDHGIALVRWSIDSMALYPGLQLARQEGRWTVTGDFIREELFSPEPGQL